MLTGVRKVGVVGAGTMGQSICEMLAANGLDVYMAEKAKSSCPCHGMIEQSLDKQMERWALTHAEKKIIMGRIHPKSIP